MSRTTLKILLLCYEYPPVGGGGGRYAHATAATLARRGHAIQAVTAGLRDLRGTAASDGVTVHRPLSGRRKRDTCSVPEMGLYLATAFPTTLRLARSWQPDVIHAHFAVPSGALAYAIHRLTRIPYVLTAHLGDVPGGVPKQTDHLFRILDPAIRPVWKSAAARTAAGRHVRDLAEKAYGLPVDEIPNGIDLTGSPAKPSPADGPVRILFAGRFNAQKNLPLLIDALARLEHRAWRLDLAGDGPERPAVETLIDQHRLRDRVRLHGWLDQDAVSELMRSSQILALPSDSEGFPAIALQALKFGLALAATRIPGIDGILVEGSNGLGATPGDPADFARAIDSLLAEPPLLERLQTGALEDAARFDIGRITDRYEATLLRAAQERPTRTT